ncbi:MAG: GerW family sporulation protein [Clostridia bacterium]|jgi:sporulation protein YtfJ|nr:GerW family sporulation protein [Clostridia bacterium]
MAEHPIQGLMSTAMENIKNMVDVNTIVGDPVTTPDGTVIIPISKVSFGFAAGGSEFSPKSGKDGLFGGGSGGGVSIQPIAFMVVGNGHVRLMPVDSANRPIDKLIDYVPDLVDKLVSSDKFTLPLRKKNTATTEE